jgi:hypothetical protein
MPEQSPTLRDMINAELERGATYRELGSRAVDPVTDKRASASIFFDIANGKLDRMPRDYHLRAIAVGLRVPYEQVRQGAIAQWVPGNGGATNLTDDEREQLRAEALRLQAIAEEARARADEALARVDRETGNGGTAGHRKSA